ncbi:alpha/beta hydrolase [Cyanobium sp. HWJ4-Hawea]|nr:alpha/beta hydrolase [Cyanobium sp. HWJ4-Hawea]
MILLHANTGTLESWKHQIQELSNRGYRVIAFDRRGWGESIGSPGSELTISVAEDLDALTRHLGIKRFHLIGVAGGSYIVLDYAAWKPESVISGVFAASTGEINEPEVLELRKRAALPGFEQWPHFLRELSPSYRAANPEGTREWKRIESTSRQAGVRFQPTLRTPNTFKKLNRIKTRILVLSADNDFYAPPALMKLIHEQLPNSTWSTINNSGHAISWEQPEEFEKEVIRFFKDGNQIKSTAKER